MFYGGGDRGTIVETVIRSLRVDDHLITVHGERGSGKTMLSLVLTDRLKHRFNTIRYDHAQISPTQLLRHLLIEICPHDAQLLSAQQAVAGADTAIVQQALQCLTTELRVPSPADRPFVLIVDSQADIDKASLQLLDDLAAIKKNGAPVLHVVLFRRVDEGAARAVSGHNGVNQPEHHYWLRRLTLVEINEYLQHHMLLFDFNRRAMFTREMGYFIADRSEGVFRAINTLARNAFMIASLEDSEQVSLSHLLMAGLPSRAEQPAKLNFFSRHRGRLIALLGSCVVVSIASLVVLLQ